MGWGGATDIFDSVVDLLLEVGSKPLFNGEYPPHEVSYMVNKAYTGIEWDDWDTESESRYWEYLEPVMRKNYPHLFDG